MPKSSRPDIPTDASSDSTDKHAREEYHLEGPDYRMHWHLVLGDNETAEHGSLDLGTFSPGSLRHERALKLAAAPAMFEALEEVERRAEDYRALPVDTNDRPESWQRLEDLLSAADDARQALAAARGEVADE